MSLFFYLYGSLVIISQLSVCVFNDNSNYGYQYYELEKSFCVFSDNGSYDNYELDKSVFLMIMVVMVIMGQIRVCF